MGRRQNKLRHRQAVMLALPPHLQKISDQVAWNKKFSGRVRDRRYDESKLRLGRVKPEIVEVLRQAEQESTESIPSKANDIEPALALPTDDGMVMLEFVGSNYDDLVDSMFGDVTEGDIPHDF